MLELLESLLFAIVMVPVVMAIILGLLLMQHLLLKCCYLGMCQNKGWILQVPCSCKCFHIRYWSNSSLFAGEVSAYGRNLGLWQ